MLRRILQAVFNREHWLALLLALILLALAIFAFGSSAVWIYQGF